MSRNKKAFGELVAQAIEANRWTAQTLADKTNTSRKTVENWKAALTSPDPGKRDEVETALGWARGAITDILTSPAGTSWRLDDVVDGGPEWEPNEWVVERARDLTTDELLRELSYRVTFLQDKVDLYETPGKVVRAEVTDKGASDGSRDATVHQFPGRTKRPESQAARTKSPFPDADDDTE